MDTLPLPPRPVLGDYVKRAEGLINAHLESTSAVQEFCNDWLAEIVRLSGPDLTDFVRGSWERADRRGRRGRSLESFGERLAKGWPRIRASRRTVANRGSAQFRELEMHLPTFIERDSRETDEWGRSSRLRPMRWSTGTFAKLQTLPAP